MNFIQRYTLLLGLCLVALAGFTQQRDTVGTYCNVFYISSGDPAVLPFDDHCFLIDEYAIKDPRKFRTVGPINAHIDLFRNFPWVMSFYFPEVRRAGEQLKVTIPENFTRNDLKMQDGQFFITLADNRNGSRYDPLPENVDFVAVSGKARVVSYQPTDGPGFDAFNVQVDARFRRVDRSGDRPVLTGEPVRLRMVVVVEALE